MNRPPTGLCLKVVASSVTDGDTVAVKLPGSANVWKVRLLDCWAPELNTEAGKQAKAFLKMFLSKQNNLHLWIPAPEKPGNLLHALTTFDRLLGHIFVDDRTTVSEVMVEAGHARKTK